MANDDDKYPGNSGRRRFVKGVVGSAALAGVGTTAGAMINATTNPSGSGGGSTQYIGVEHIDGPAPRAMPMIPIEIDAQGYIKGVFPKWKTTTVSGKQVQTATMQVGDVEYSVDWFQYCGVQTYGGLQPDAQQDNYFRYSDAPPYSWQQEQVQAGQKINVADFSDYTTWGDGIGQSGLGKPAMGTWRSQGEKETMPVQVLRIPPARWGKVDCDSPSFLKAASSQNFIAWLDKCTHFCCVPGFKALAQSERFDAENDIYCPCHQSVYNPYNLVKQTFVALPRPA